MNIPVLVELTSEDRFRATSGEPLGLSAEGGTRDEAIDKLRQLVDERIASGAEVVSLEVNSSPHPLASFAGMLKDDPLLDDWKQAMAEYRDEADNVADPE